MESAGAELPAEISDHLIGCAECRIVYERALSLCRLISLKKYEQPDPSLETRILAKVEAGIRDLEENPRSWADRLFEIFAGRPVPVLRYVMALLVVGLIGLNLLSANHMPALPATSIEAQKPPSPVRVAPRAVAETRYYNPALPVVFLASNTQPASVQYGPGASRLVGFEY
jgi:hypothetical protein